MAYSQSLFNAPVQSSYSEALRWIGGTLLGEVAVMICVIAVAFIGLLMLTGQLPVRRGMQVVLGCFILLGAPAVAFSIASIGQDTVVYSPPIGATEASVVYEREELPPASENPYARASLRRD